MRDAHAGARTREAQGDAHAGARMRSYAGRLLLSSGNANYSPPNPLGGLSHTVMERVKGTAVFDSLYGIAFAEYAHQGK